MDFFHYKSGELFAENISVSTLAKEFGTPLYVYSRDTLTRHWHIYDNAFKNHPHLICYSVKANSNIAVLNVLAKLASGFDIVSGGELERVLVAGGEPDKIIFSGVAKTVEEIKHALEINIGSFNIESSAELERIHKVASEIKLTANIAFRVNPDISVVTHPYITTGLKHNKFGVPYDNAIDLYRKAKEMPYINIVGIACHIGSQILEITPFLAVIDKMLELQQTLSSHGINIYQIDMGGGLGVSYQHEKPAHPQALIAAVLSRLSDQKTKIIIEPGRSIVANAGILVTKVEYLKSNPEHRFAVVDAGMNDLLRPALYSAEQEIIPVIPRDSTSEIYDVVGPVCESGDFLGKNRKLAIEAEDLLAVRTSGAYGFSMSSNYNSRPKPAEVMVDGDQAYLIRERETIQDLYAKEHLMDN